MASVRRTSSVSTVAAAAPTIPSFGISAAFSARLATAENPVVRSTWSSRPLAMSAITGTSRMSAMGMDQMSTWRATLAGAYSLPNISWMICGARRNPPSTTGRPAATTCADAVW